jgi:hypothetical protein
MSAVAKVLRARHPELATEVGENGAVQQAQANSPLIRCGNELVAVMSMPARIPDDAGLWSRAAGTWPESKSVAARLEWQGRTIRRALAGLVQPIVCAVSRLPLR